jgi:hypothetical protein
MVNDIATISRLLEGSPDLVEQVDEKGASALHIAATNGYAGVCQLLCQVLLPHAADHHALLRVLASVLKRMPRSVTINLASFWLRSCNARPVPPRYSPPRNPPPPRSAGPGRTSRTGRVAPRSTRRGRAATPPPLRSSRPLRAAERGPASRAHRARRRRQPQRRRRREARPRPRGRCLRRGRRRRTRRRRLTGGGGGPGGSPGPGPGPRGWGGGPALARFCGREFGSVLCPGPCVPPVHPPAARRPPPRFTHAHGTAGTGCWRVGPAQPRPCPATTGGAGRARGGRWRQGGRDGGAWGLGRVGLQAMAG